MVVVDVEGVGSRCGDGDRGKWIGRKSESIVFSEMRLVECSVRRFEVRFLP